MKISLIFIDFTAIIFSLSCLVLPVQFLISFNTVYYYYAWIHIYIVIFIFFIICLVLLNKQLQYQ